MLAATPVAATSIPTRQTLSQRDLSLDQLLRQTIDELRPVLRDHGLSLAEGHWRVESVDFARAFDQSVQGERWAERLWGWGGKPDGWPSRLPDAWLRALVRLGGRALGRLTCARVDTRAQTIRVNRNLVRGADYRLLKSVLAHELAHEALDRRYRETYQPTPFLQFFAGHFRLSAALGTMKTRARRERALEEFLVDKLLREGHPERIMRDYQNHIGADFARLPGLPLVDRALARFARDNQLALPDVKTLLTALAVSLLSPLARYTYAAYVEGGKIPGREFPRLWADAEHRQAVLGAKARQIIRGLSNRALARRILTWPNRRLARLARRRPGSSRTAR